MSRLARDGTAEPVSRDQILRRERLCSADHEQDWLPYPVDPYSAICDDHTYIQCRALRNSMFMRLGTGYEIRNGGYFETIKNGADYFRRDSFQMAGIVES